MSRKKEYAFEFPGTRDEFLKGLDLFPGRLEYSGNALYLGEYIVEIDGDQIRFGVARGGHSGGYWFIPEITECDGRTELRGTIEYIGPGTHRSPMGRLWDRVEMCLLTVFFSPVILIVKLYTLIDRAVRRLTNRPKPKEKTEEDGLYDLMENHFGCIRK